MNIQHLIRSALQGNNPVPRYAHESGDLGTNYESERFQIPVRQCDFVLTTSLDNHKTPILLSSFTIPAFGLTFEYQQGALVTQVPTVSPVTITGYIPQHWQANISNFYYRQFKGGLLNADLHRMDVTIHYIRFNEDHTADMVKLVSATTGKIKAAKAAKMVAGKVADLVTSALSVPAGVMGPIQSVFDAQSPCDSAESEDEELPQSILNPTENDADGVLHPLFTFENVRFSAPDFSTDVTSNDLATVSLNFSYTNVLQHQVTI